MNRIKVVCNNSEKTKKIKSKVYKLIKEFGFLLDPINPDIIISIGGDGTFLKSLKESNYNKNACYLGIHTGHLGFLQDIKPNEIRDLFYAIKSNNYKIDNIYLEDIKFYFQNKVIQYKALNEIVIREKNLKVLKVEVKLDDKHLEDFSGDGFLISTPTGSTAYNLSIGGAIMYPSINALQLSPLAPLPSSIHFANLNNNIIIPEDIDIKIIPKPVSKNKILAVIDGETLPFGFSIDKITVSIDKTPIKLLRLNNYDFCNRINEKFISLK